MSPEWFKRRGYRHFDLPVDEKFARKAMDSSFVSRHSFSPLIHYEKIEIRYKKNRDTGVRLITRKKRPIKYASHRDACILSYYSKILNQAIDAYYERERIGDSVIAYRALGRGNYDFSAEVLAFARVNQPVAILAFDVTSFFDNLDHGLLKKRLRSILDVPTLPNDWHRIFRFITRFHYVELETLKKHPEFGDRLKKRSRDRIASVEEMKEAGVLFHPNAELAKGFTRGIPQGTPISATASNLYMIEFDVAARSYCDEIGALYRRYSDDILVICRPDHAEAAEAMIMGLIAQERLEIAPHKTEKTVFGGDAAVPGASRAAQYLGFTLDEGGPAIRESSLARQWRKMRRAVRRIRKVATLMIAAGKSDTAHTKRLRRRFTHLKVNDGTTLRTLRNFSSYGRRSAKAFGAGEKISGQVNPSSPKSSRFSRFSVRFWQKMAEMLGFVFGFHL